jgi:hypothetical protein
VTAAVRAILVLAAVIWSLHQPGVQMLGAELIHLAPAILSMVAWTILVVPAGAFLFVFCLLTVRTRGR